MNDLAKLVADELEAYTDEVQEAMDAAADIVAKETNKIIKSHIQFNQPTGKYVKAFRIAKTSKGRESGRLWYVKAPHYRLTHLLEKGHLTRSGSRVKAYPHIRYGEEYAQANLMKEFEEQLNK